LVFAAPEGTLRPGKPAKSPVFIAGGNRPLLPLSGIARGHGAGRSRSSGASCHWNPNGDFWQISAISCHRQPFLMPRPVPRTTVPMAVLRPIRPAGFWPESRSMLHARRGWGSAFQRARPFFFAFFATHVGELFARVAPAASSGRFSAIPGKIQAPLELPDGLVRPASAWAFSIEMFAFRIAHPFHW
jgi:hypothetical protein